MHTRIEQTFGGEKNCGVRAGGTFGSWVNYSIMHWVVLTVFSHSTFDFWADFFDMGESDAVLFFFFSVNEFKITLRLRHNDIQFCIYLIMYYKNEEAIQKHCMSNIGDYIFHPHLFLFCAVANLSGLISLSLCSLKPQ